MSDPSGGEAGSGPAKVAEIIEKAYAILDSRLRDHASGHDGVIQVRDLTAIRQTVTPDRNPALGKLVSTGWSDMAEIYEKQFWAKQRKFPLERLIVHRFDLLLAARGETAIQRKTLSRRCIPAFLYALLQMVGQELFEDYGLRCRALVEETREAEGDAFSWDHLYSNPSARVLVADILVFIARYFDDVPKRRRWMIDIFDRAMPPAVDPEEKEWRFGAIEFHMLFDALYGDLTQALADKSIIVNLKKRYGVSNLRTVTQMLKNLKIDRESIEASIQNHYAL